MPSALRVVAITHDAFYRDLLLQIAARLKSEYGSRIYWYAPRDEVRPTILSHALADALDGIEVIPKSDRTKSDLLRDREACIAEGRRIEATYGGTINRYAVTDRHLGRGFAPAGFGFPRSRQSEGNDYWDLLATYCGYFNFWEKEFAEKDISLLITSGWREAAVAHAHGAAVRRPMSSRYKNLHFWATDAYGFSDRLSSIFERKRQSRIVEPVESVAEAPYVTKKLIQSQKAINSVGYVSRQIALKLRNYAYYSLKGHSKAAEYYLSDELRYFVRQWWHARQLMADDMPRMDDVLGTDFVYFPLQVDPEFGFQGQSPEFFFQHTAILALSRDLPAGVRLVVKEHLPALGYRPGTFYGQLRDLKNVVLLNIREPSLELIKASRAVACITGTAGQEAAMFGKPVVTFGRHNLYNCFPHVYPVTDIGDLSGILDRALSTDVSDDVAMQLSGAYVAALKEISFDLEKTDLGNKVGFSEAAAVQAFVRLRDGLQDN